MIESGYYAPGTEFNRNSPWNQKENPEEEFNVTIVETLSKDVTIVTTNYNLEEDCDEDGYYRHCDTSDTPWKDEYKKQGCTAIETIIAVKTYLEEVRLQQLKDINRCRPLTESEEKELRVVKDLIKQCSDWKQEEIEFCPE
jgi:hypothetical protein